MPPITATTWRTAIRRLAFAARQHIEQKAKSTRPARARAIALAKETFPSLAQPTFPSAAPRRALAYQPIAIRAQTPYQRAHLAVRNAPFRLGSTHPRGPAVVGQVGLGSARSFSSGPGGSAANNASILLRAFVNLGDDDSLPRSTKYHPYVRPRRQRQAQRNSRRSMRSSCVASTKSRTSSGFEYYFPRPAVSTSVPPHPEALVTEGVTTTLAVALAPSLQDLLSPTVQLSYAETEIGVSVFSNLLKGVLPLHELYSLHESTHVLPLLYKLTSLGVLSTDLGPKTARLEVIPDYEGRPDILHIVFPHRSPKDIRILLADTLGEEAWYALYESTPLSAEEDAAIAEQWEVKSSEPSSMPSSVATEFSLSSHSSSEDMAGGQYSPSPEMSLVIPRIDMSESTIDSSGFLPQEEHMAWSSSEDGSDLAWSIQTTSEVHTPSNDSPAWSVSPSEADSEIESLIEEMVWSEELDRSRAPSPEMWYTSSGGYGFLQPW